LPESDARKIQVKVEMSIFDNNF